MGEGTGNFPYHETDERIDVYWATTEELWNKNVSAVSQLTWVIFQSLERVCECTRTSEIGINGDVRFFELRKVYGYEGMLYNYVYETRLTSDRGLRICFVESLLVDVAQKVSVMDVQTIGPSPRPQTNRDSPRVATSRGT